MLSTGWEDVLGWWDGVELWLTQLWFPLQLSVLMLVLLPTCWWVALLIDRTVDLISDWLDGRAATPDAPVVSGAPEAGGGTRSEGPR